VRKEKRERKRGKREKGRKGKKKGERNPSITFRTCGRSPSKWCVRLSLSPSFATGPRTPHKNRKERGGRREGEGRRGDLPRLFHLGGSWAIPLSRWSYPPLHASLLQSNRLVRRGQEFQKERNKKKEKDKKKEREKKAGTVRYFLRILPQSTCILPVTITAVPRLQTDERRGSGWEGKAGGKKGRGGGRRKGKEKERPARFHLPLSQPRPR